MPNIYRPCTGCGVTRNISVSLQCPICFEQKSKRKPKKINLNDPRRSKRPSKEKLLSLIDKKIRKSEWEKMFDVSSATIVKWLREYEIIYDKKKLKA